MNLRILLFVACVACLRVGSCAQDIQARAEGMMEHGRQLSDIRAPNSPAFRLKATFSFVGDDLETVQGTYTEVWVSNSQWRREIAVGDLRSIEVGGPDKQWLLDPDEFPSQANKLAALMSVLPPPSRHFHFASITEREMREVTAECAESKPAAAKVPFAFCFEKKSGMLLERVSPETRPLNVVVFSCEYGAFRKFGNYWFPRQVRCFEDRHKTISADVVELSLETPIDRALFDAPQDAVELDQCSGKTVFPIPPNLPPTTPRGFQLDPVARIRVSLVVEANGRAQNLRVLPPARKDPNQGVLDWVRRWKFTPGKCDGKPMPMELTIEVPSMLR
jgi:hypothetical protein